jgi:hypothetical protein
MRVRILKSMTTDRGAFQAGDIPLVPDEVAVEWIKGGLAQAVRIDPPDTTEAPARGIETATLASPTHPPEVPEPFPDPEPEPEPEPFAEASPAPPSRPAMRPPIKPARRAPVRRKR